jgi:hypothetical protein
MPIERSFSIFRVPVPETHNAAPAEYVGRAALVYALGSQNPQRQLVAAAPID